MPEACNLQSFSYRWGTVFEIKSLKLVPYIAHPYIVVLIVFIYYSMSVASILFKHVLDEKLSMSVIRSLIGYAQIRSDQSKRRNLLMCCTGSAVVIMCTLPTQSATLGIWRWYHGISGIAEEQWQPSNGCMPVDYGECHIWCNDTWAVIITIWCIIMTSTTASLWHCTFATFFLAGKSDNSGS